MCSSDLPPILLQTRFICQAAPSGAAWLSLRLDHHSCFCPALPRMACLLYVLSAPLGQGRHPLHRPPVPRLSIPLFFIQQTAPRFLQRPSPPIELAALAAYAEGVVPLRLRRAVTKPGPDAGHGGAGGLGPRRPRPLAASPRRRPGPRAGQRPSIGRLAIALREFSPPRNE